MCFASALSRKLVTSSDPMFSTLPYCLNVSVSSKIPSAVSFILYLWPIYLALSTRTPFLSPLSSSYFAYPLLSSESLSLTLSLLPSTYSPLPSIPQLTKSKRNTAQSPPKTSATTATAATTATKFAIPVLLSSYPPHVQAALPLPTTSMRTTTTATMVTTATTKMTRMATATASSTANKTRKSAMVTALTATKTSRMKRVKIRIVFAVMTLWSDWLSKQTGSGMKMGFGALNEKHCLPNFLATNERFGRRLHDTDRHISTFDRTLDGSKSMTKKT